MSNDRLKFKFFSKTVTQISCFSKSCYFVTNSVLKELIVESWFIHPPGEKWKRSEMTVRNAREKSYSSLWLGRGRFSYKGGWTDWEFTQWRLYYNLEKQSILPSEWSCPLHGTESCSFHQNGFPAVLLFGSFCWAFYLYNPSSISASHC